MSLVVASTGVYFLADTHVRYDPSAEEIAETAVACAVHVRRFGLEPKIALISHSDFGSADTPSALKMREALRLLQERAPDLEVDGEMQADTALSLVARQRVITNSRLEGEANVLIFPNLDAGSTALQLTRVIADALPIGPILIGPAKPAHVLTPSVTARGIVNMTAIAAVEAASEQATFSARPGSERGANCDLTAAASGAQSHRVVTNRQREGDATPPDPLGRQKDGVAMTPPGQKDVTLARPGSQRRRRSTCQSGRALQTSLTQHSRRRNAKAKRSSAEISSATSQKFREQRNRAPFRLSAPGPMLSCPVRAVAFQLAARSYADQSFQRLAALLSISCLALSKARSEAL